MPGRWHREPYTFRKYSQLEEYVVADQLGRGDASDAEAVKAQLSTKLDGFMGQAYNYDDHGLTEEWMSTFKDGNFTASEDDLIRTQLGGLMEILLAKVTDRVCTENGVLKRPPVGLGSRLKECPVWGIDCYTRRMVELSIIDRVGDEATPEALKTFIERRLLPSINRQAPELAHNMNYAINSILEVIYCPIKFSLTLITLEVIYLMYYFLLTFIRILPPPSFT